MPLYVIRQPDPLPGADWIATVPGQYLYDIVGITATLDTGGAPDLPTDASGNGNHGTYVASPFGLQFTAGALTGDDGFVAGTLVPKRARGGFTIPPAGMPFTGSFTLVWWEMNPHTGGDSGHDLIAYDAGNTAIFSAFVANNGSIRVAFNAGGSWNSGNVVPTLDDLWHQIAVSYNAGTQTATLYLDGAVTPNVGPVAGGPLGAAPNVIRWGLAFSNAATMIGNSDELAYVPAALNAGQIAALYATAPNFAAYTAAQLALTPNVYYHLDGVVSGGGQRQVTLEVTDGTHTLELVPTGFAEIPTGGPFTYSWQPRLAASAQTTDGVTTTVAIPRLILPAGYTVGARTLDLGGADQWSGVNIWWDSTLMDIWSGLYDYRYAPGYKLDYHYDPTAP